MTRPTSPTSARSAGSRFCRHGLEVEAVERFDEWLDFDSWLARTGCEGETALRVRALLAGRGDGLGWRYPYIVVKARKRR